MLSSRKAAGLHTLLNFNLNHYHFTLIPIPDFGSTFILQGHRKIIFFKGTEVNNSTEITFMTLKLDFNHGGCKWTGPERARTIVGKYSIQPCRLGRLITRVLYTATRRAWTSLNIPLRAFFPLSKVSGGRAITLVQWFVTCLPPFSFPLLDLLMCL